MDGKEEKSFEDHLAALEEAIDELEAGNLALEAQLERFAGAVASASRCRELLKEARRRTDGLVRELRDEKGET